VEDNPRYRIPCYMLYAPSEGARTHSTRQAWGMRVGRESRRLHERPASCLEPGHKQSTLFDVESVGAVRVTVQHVHPRVWHPHAAMPIELS
jgi:hypothetical protein